MSDYRALYRKWRPETFDDVCGQDSITDILKYETKNNKISHAYLFCGSRGTGKTSCAKILAKAVNCLDPQNGNPCCKCSACKSIEQGLATDVIEMDAASNNGVDNVRDMKDEIAFTPAELKYRVYIIDEVHMMSGAAFNALLKTLEEPPSYVLFILATTEYNKLPTTIVSRCQRFDFKRISTDVIVKRLQHISANEGIEISGKNAVVIGRSNIVGKPMAMLLLAESATVTVCHSRTRELAEITRRADILVSAVGKAKFVTADMVKEGAVVIDVGMNRDENGKLCGDVDFDGVKEKCSFITPVPGGVGPMTITMLLANTISAAIAAEERKKFK